MRARAASFLTVLVLLVAPAGAHAGERPPRTIAEVDSLVATLLAPEACSVEWHAAPEPDARATLELGTGSGHGRSLNWLRLEPEADHVAVLALGSTHPFKVYRTKWPEDDVPLEVGRASMDFAAYRLLLHGLARIGSATLVAKPDAEHRWSSSDFHASARLARGAEVRLDERFAGYRSTDAEARYAKAKAMTELAFVFLEACPIEAGELGAADRAWVSARFAREWEATEKEQFWWWVREHSIELAGVAGDKAAIPVLARIVEGDATKRPVYFAINAIMRLAGEDVRPEPVADMDTEEARVAIRGLVARLGGK